MKSSLVFGSTAAKFWFPDFPREPQDLDVMSQGEKISTKAYQTYWWDTFEEILEINKDEKYLDPDLLYTLKCSHSRWPIHLQKTLSDILFFQKKGCQLNVPIYKKLIKDFTKTHGKKWASLKGKDSESFFKDAVKRVIPHDDLHLVCAHYDRPLYERILKNPETNSVECSEEKFNNLSEGDKLLLVKEEVWATALERWLIPANFKYSQNLAYAKSLEKMLTTMSSGWITRWMISNYNLLYKNTDWSFITKFKQKYNYE